MSSQSQSFTITASAQSATWPAYYSTILVENNSATATLYVRADGTAAVVDAAGTESIGVNENIEIVNPLGLPNPNTVPNKDMSESWGWTAQTPYQGSGLTQVSFIGSAAAGEVTLTPQ